MIRNNFLGNMCPNKFPPHLLIGLNYSNANWDCSDDKDDAIINPMTDKITDEELYKRWGNFSMEDLIWLESDYSEWITNHDCDKLSVRRLVQRICIKELALRKAQEKGLPTENTPFIDNLIR